MEKETKKVVKVRCIYCGEYINRPNYNTHLQKEHDLIYVAIEKSDLNRLIQFIYIKDESLLTKSLVETLQTFHNNASKKQLVEKE
jgi:hypothetical protein